MIITVDPDRGFHERVLAAVAGTTWAQRSAHVADPGHAVEAVTSNAVPTVVVVGPRVSVPAATSLTQRLVAGSVPVAVLLVTEPTNDVLRSAMRAGARDVLPPTFDDVDLLAAIDRTQLAGVSQSAGPGVTVAVFSTKGGVGTSTVAANLAARLGERLDTESVLLDLDVASADQAIMHGLQPQWTLQELVNGSVGTDVESLRQVLLPIDDGATSLLPGPLDPALAETISGDAVGRIIAASRAVSPVVVLDTASSFDDRTLAAIDAADVIVIVSSLDVAALRALTVALQTFDRIGVDPGKVRVALVRADSRSGLQVSDVERAIGRGVDGRIPSSRAVVQSLNNGVPLAVSSPRSGYVQAIDELIDSILERASDALRELADGSSSRSWFPFGRGRGDGGDGRSPSSRPTVSPAASAPAVPAPPRAATRPDPASPAAERGEPTAEQFSASPSPDRTNGVAPAATVDASVERPGPASVGRQPEVVGHGDEVREGHLASSVAVAEAETLVVPDDDERDEEAVPEVEAAASEQPVDEPRDEPGPSARHAVSLDALPPPRTGGADEPADGGSRRFGRRR